MALVDVLGGLWMPDVLYTIPGGIALGSTLLDAAADRVAVVFLAPKTGNIRKIGFLTGTVPVLGGTTTLVYALQDVSVTTGDPDGTDDQTATIANGSILASTMILSGTLSADRAVTRGDRLAAVVRYGTFNAGDQVNIQMLSTPNKVLLASQAPEYVDLNTTGTYAHQSTLAPVLEIEYDDGTHAFSSALQYPFSAVSSDTYNSGSTPDEIGLQFQVPFPCRLGGFWMNADLDGDCAINLYTASAKTTCLSMDKDLRVGTGAGSLGGLLTTPVVLAANTAYVLSVEPSSATNLVLFNYSVRAAVALDQMAGGQAWQYATAKNPTTTADFTATTTKRPVMGLMFDQVDNGLGGARATYAIGV